MRSDLRAALLAAPDVAAMVGARVYPNIRPQASPLPALVLTVVSGRRDYHTRGVGTLKTRRVQVDVFASTAQDAEDLSNATEEALSGFSGVVGGTRFQGVFLDAERDGFEPAQEEGSAVYRRILDFMISYRSA